MTVITSIGQNANPDLIVNTHATALANTAVVITLLAAPGMHNILHNIQWSYDSAPTGGRLTVEDGLGTIVWDADIVAAADRLEALDTFIVGSINTDMVITLAAGGGAVIGKLNTESIIYP